MEALEDSLELPLIKNPMILTKNRVNLLSLLKGLNVRTPDRVIGLSFNEILNESANNNGIHKEKLYSSICLATMPVTTQYSTITSMLRSDFEINKLLNFIINDGYNMDEIATEIDKFSYIYYSHNLTLDNVLTIKRYLKKDFDSWEKLGWLK